MILGLCTPAIYGRAHDKANAEVVFSTMKQVITVDTLEGICSGNLGRDSVIFLKLICCACLLVVNVAKDWAALVMLINYALVFSLEGKDGLGVIGDVGKYDEYTPLSVLARSNDFGILIRNAFSPFTGWCIYADRHHEGIAMPNGDVVFVGDQVQAGRSDCPTKSNLETGYKEIAVLSVKRLKQQIPSLVKTTSNILLAGFLAACGIVLLDGFFFGVWVQNPVSQIVVIIGTVLFSVKFCDDLTQRFVAYNMNKHFTLVIIIALAAAQNVAVSKVGWVQDSSQIDKKEQIFPLASLVILIGVVLTLLVKMDADFSLEKSIFKSNNTGLTQVSINNIVKGNFDALEANELAALIDYFATRLEKDTSSVLKYSLKKLWIDHRMAAITSLQDHHIAAFLDWYQGSLSSLSVEQES